jgi:hypothetical protein
MQCILYKIYFWKVFHMHYKLICILYALLCGQNFILVKSGCYNNLASYVVESSLDIPTGCAGSYDGRITRMFSEATMAESWDGVGKAAMAETHKAQEGLLVG